MCLLFTNEYLRVYVVSIKQYTLIVYTRVGTEVGDIYCAYFVLLLLVFQVVHFLNLIADFVLI